MAKERVYNVNIRFKLAELRARHGLTIHQCSLLIGAPLQAIYHWEKGEAVPKIQMLFHIKKAFQIATIDEMFEEITPATAEEIPEILRQNMPKLEKIPAREQPVSQPVEAVAAQ